MSKDQLILDLTIALQYQYKQDHIIPTIMMKFSDEANFKSFFHDKIMTSIIAVCGNFTAEQYYQERGPIETTIFNKVVSNIDIADIGLDIVFLQLKNIDFPSDFADAITKKQLEQQEAVTQLNNRTSLMIDTNSTLIASKQLGATTIIFANNTALINIKQALIDKEIIVNQWLQRGLAYNATKHNLDLNDTRFVKFLEYDLLRTSVTPVVSISDP